MGEKEWILTEAAKVLPGIDALTNEQRADAVDPILPRQRPDWNYRTEQSRKSLSIIRLHWRD